MKTLLIAVTLLVLVTAGFTQPPPEVGTIRGQVLDQRNRQPIAGAITNLRVPDKSGSYTRIYPIPGMNATTTDAQGWFLFRGIPEGEYQLSASAGSFRPSSQKITVSATQPLTIEIPLAPLHYITGTVYKPDGAPAAAVPIYATLEWSGSPYQMSFQTDAAGKFQVLFYTPAQHRLLTRVFGVGVACNTFTTTADEDCPQDFHLQPGGIIEGTVKDQLTGQPMAGVQVYAQCTGVSGGPALPAPYPSISAQTDDKGSFKLVDVPAGSWGVKPVGPRVLSFNEVRIDLQPGQRQEGAGIVMTLGATVIGKLLGIHGQPLVAPPNVLLEVCGRSSDGKHTLAPAEQIAIDAQGQFVFNAKQVGDAQLRVLADKEGFAASSWVKLEEGKSLELEFRLRPFQRIVGRVVETGTHRPLAGAVVKVDPVTSGEPPVAWTADRLCDNEGRFALESLAPAQYTLSATANGFTLPKPILLSVPEQGNPPEVTVEMERAAPAK